MKKLRAIVCGYYGQGNGGDEALLVSLLQMLPSRVQPFVLSGNPQQTKKAYQVDSLPRKQAFAIVKAMNASDWFIWGGGSLMQDVTSISSPFYYAGLMGLAQQRGLKTIAWAQGIGPLQYPWSRWLTRQVLTGADAVSVRDSTSAQKLAQWQIPALIAPDPVWALQEQPVKGLWDYPAPRVAVCLRPHPQLTAQKLSAVTEALNQFQRATNTFILLVPFQARTDEKIAAAIAAGLVGQHQTIYLSDPRQLKGLFRGVEMTIGMRYHSLIMAAAQECRCWAISYDPKVDRLMSELKLPGWSIAEMPQDPSLISRAWIEQYANGEALTPSQIQSLVDRAKMHQTLLEC